MQVTVGFPSEGAFRRFAAKTDYCAGVKVTFPLCALKFADPSLRSGVAGA
jgi:hypothetical protein